MRDVCQLPKSYYLAKLNTMIFNGSQVPKNISIFDIIMHDNK